MGIEGTAREADVRGPVLPKPLHQVGAAAYHPDRQSAGHRFTVGDHVGADPEILLNAAAGQPKAEKDLIENQHDAAF